MLLNKGNTRIRMIGDKRPRILIEPKTLDRINKIVDLSSEEVSWFSLVEQNGNEFIIKEAFLVEQEVLPAQTEMTLSGLADFFNDMISARGIEYYNKIRCWGHSHVNMAPSPSGQDTKQIAEFDNGEFYIMLICNKHGTRRADFYDFENGIAFEDLDIEIDLGEDNNIADIKEELGKKVRSARPSYGSAGKFSVNTKALESCLYPNSRRDAFFQTDERQFVNQCLLDEEIEDDVDFEDAFDSALEGLTPDILRDMVKGIAEFSQVLFAKFATDFNLRVSASDRERVLFDVIFKTLSQDDSALGYVDAEDTGTAFIFLLSERISALSNLSAPSKEAIKQYGSLIEKFKLEISFITDIYDIAEDGFMKEFAKAVGFCIKNNSISVKKIKEMFDEYI